MVEGRHVAPNPAARSARRSSPTGRRPDERVGDRHPRPRASAPRPRKRTTTGRQLAPASTIRPNATSAPSGTLALALRVFLRRSRPELESDEALVANHPGVVAGLDDVCLARTDLQLGAVLVFDGQAAGVDNADVASLAASVPATGLTHSDQRHSGSNVIRAAVVTPIRTTATCVLAGVRVSSGESKSRDSTAATAVFSR